MIRLNLEMLIVGRKGIFEALVQENIITLPLFPSMSDQDINDVIEAVKKVITYFTK